MSDSEKIEAKSNLRPTTLQTEKIDPNKAVDNPAPKKGIKARIGKFSNWYKTHKKLAIPLSLVVVAAVLLIIPVTRYKILGTFIKKDISVYVVDSKSDTVVSDAEVTLGSISAKTNGRGVAELSAVPVGQYKMKVTKKYYNNYEQNITVTTASNQALNAKIIANGRPVSVKIINRIDQKTIEGVSIKVGEVSSKTDEEGIAILVLPVGTTTAVAELSGDGYISTKAEISSSDTEIKQNTLGITATGKIYFLSKASGKIDVIKTNLDGTDRKTVLSGTGNEDEYNTVLLASRDWKYLALHAKREGDKSKLYLIETDNDKLTTMDEGDASFDLVGWSNDKFVYKVTRNQPKQWEAKKYALKSYDAAAKKINQLDDTLAVGSSNYDYAYQIFGSVYLIDSKVIYEKNWFSDNYYSSLINDKKDAIYRTGDSGGNRENLKEVFHTAGQTSYIQSYLYEPREIYFKITENDADKYYEYNTQGKLVEDSKIKDDFEKNLGPAGYTTYLVSPSAKSTFWNESRDGKGALFVGDQDAQGEKQIALLTDDFQTYGWYTDRYLLVSKKGSELYILPSSGVKDEKQLVKISDYHKPTYSYYGYGGGYGGI